MIIKKMPYTMLAVIFLSLVLCTACGVDFYAGKRPTNYENTKWVCNDPDMFFEVNEKYGEITGSSTYGQINIDGAITEIAVSFNFGTAAKFRPISSYKTRVLEDGTVESYIAGNEWLFWGECRFSKNKLIVNVTDNSKGFLDDSIKTLTFIREDVVYD